MFYKICETCRKKRFFARKSVRKREIEIPHAGPATSRKTMCNKCFKAINKALKTK